MAVDTSTVRVEWAYPDYDSMLTDSRGEGGGAGWFPRYEYNAKFYKRREYKIPALEYTTPRGPGPYFVVDTTGLSDPVVWTRRLPPLTEVIELEVGLQAGSAPVTLGVEYLSNTGSILNSYHQTIAGETRTATAAGWTKLIARGILNQTDVGNQSIRFTLTGAGVYAVRNVKYVDGSVNGDTRDAAYFTSRGYSIPSMDQRGVWNDATGSCQAISIRRGCRPNPPVDQLEIGTAVLRFKTGPTNPAAATYGPIGPGYRVRVSGWNGTEWETVFEGRLTEVVPTQKVGDSPGYVEWQAVDRVADIAQTETDYIRGSKAGERIENVLNPRPNGIHHRPAIRIQNDRSYGYGVADVAVYNERGNTLDHMLTVRNSHYGLLWVDKENQFQFVSGDTAVPEPRMRPTLTFRTTSPGAGEKSPVLSGWDRQQDNAWRLNNLNVTRLWTEPYGTQQTISNQSRWIYTRDAMVWGRRVGSVNIINGVPPGSNDYGGAQYAARDWIYAYSDKSYALDQFEYNASKDVASACKVDVYDNVNLYVTETPTLPTSYRIIGLEHDIRPGKWMVKFIIRPKERRYTGSPVVALPDGDGGTP